MLEISPSRLSIGIQFAGFTKVLANYTSEESLITAVYDKYII